MDKNIKSFGKWEIEIDIKKDDLDCERIIIRDKTGGKTNIYTVPVEGWSDVVDRVDDENPILIRTTLKIGDCYFEVRSDGVLDFSYLGNWKIFSLNVSKSLTQNLRLLMLEKAGRL